MTEKSREAFEAIFSAPPYEFDVTRFGPHSPWHGNYALYNVQCAWSGWQAGRKQAIEACIAVLSDDHDESQPAEFRKKLKELL